MFTSIKQRDLNTPLLLRLEKQLSEKDNTAIIDDQTLSNVEPFVPTECNDDAFLPSTSQDVVIVHLAESCPTMCVVKSAENDDSNLNDSGKENDSKELFIDEETNSENISQDLYNNQNADDNLNTLNRDSQDLFTDNTVPNICALTNSCVIAESVQISSVEKHECKGLDEISIKARDPEAGGISSKKETEIHCATQSSKKDIKFSNLKKQKKLNKPVVPFNCKKSDQCLKRKIDKEHVVLTKVKKKNLKPSTGSLLTATKAKVEDLTSHTKKAPFKQVKLTFMKQSSSSFKQSSTSSKLQSSCKQAAKQPVPSSGKQAKTCSTIKPASGFKQRVSSKQQSSSYKLNKPYLQPYSAPIKKDNLCSKNTLTHKVEEKLGKPFSNSKAEELGSKEQLNCTDKKKICITQKASCDEKGESNFPEELSCKSKDSCSIKLSSCSIPEVPCVKEQKSFSDKKGKTSKQEPSSSCNNPKKQGENENNSSNLLQITKELMEDFHIQFEDDSPCPTAVDVTDKKETSVKKGHRRKSRRSMDFTPNKPVLLEEGRDSNGTPSLTPGIAKTSDNALQTVTINRCGLETTAKQKKTRKRRISADVQILNNEISFSPDIELDGLDEMKSLPGTRRSRRIQRQSIELCRRKPYYCDSPDSDIINDEEDPIQNEAECLPVSLAGLKLSTDEGKSTSTLAQSPIANILLSCGDNSLNLIENAVKKDEIPKQEDENSTQRRKRSCSKKVNYNENVENCETSNCETEVKKPKAKGGKRKRKQDDEGPSVEDIYLNKMWKKQMPDPEKTWETIFEVPHNKSGKEDFYSAKRYKRALSYENFYTQQKLKRRRQKASKLGYKPLSKKKHEQFEQLVAEKLSLLEEELETIKEETFVLTKPETFCESSESNSKFAKRECDLVSGQNDTNSCDDSVHKSPAMEAIEETFYTPMKSMHDKAFDMVGKFQDELAEERIHTVDVNMHNKSEDNTGSNLSDSEDVFETPQKTPNNWKNKYNQVNQMDFIEEESEFDSSGNSSQVNLCLKL